MDKGNPAFVLALLACCLFVLAGCDNSQNRVTHVANMSISKTVDNNYLYQATPKSSPKQQKKSKHFNSERQFAHQKSVRNIEALLTITSMVIVLLIILIPSKQGSLQNVLSHGPTNSMHSAAKPWGVEKYLLWLIKASIMLLLILIIVFCIKEGESYVLSTGR